MSKAVKYLVKSTLHHDGKVYPEGSEIELSDIYAEPLLKADVIEPVPEIPEETVTNAAREIPFVEDVPEPGTGEPSDENSETEDSSIKEKPRGKGKSK